MPIETKCPSCSATIRAPDKYAGKRVKCPKCQAAIAVPGGAAKESTGQKATAAASAAKPPQQPKATEKPKQPPKPAPAKQAVAPAKQPAKQPAKKLWYVQTDDGEQYGPVSKDELHQWVAEGRLDASCQVLCEGWEQWKWAEEVFAELADAEAEAKEPAGEDNPFAGIGDTTPQTESINPFAGIGETTSPAESVNPFDSPQKSSSPTVTDSEPGDGSITPVMRQALAQTRPWVFFLSILGFIAGGLVVLGCLGWLIFALLAISQAGASAFVLMIVPLVYGAASALYLYAAYFLYTYASQIANFLRNNQAHELERALVAQKSFWRLVGIVTAISLGASVLLFLLFLAVGALASASVTP